MRRRLVPDSAQVRSSASSTATGSNGESPESVSAFGSSSGRVRPAVRPRSAWAEPSGNGKIPAGSANGASAIPLRVTRSAPASCRISPSAGHLDQQRPRTGRHRGHHGRRDDAVRRTGVGGLERRGLHVRLRRGLERGGERLLSGGAEVGLRQQSYGRQERAVRLGELPDRADEIIRADECLGRLGRRGTEPDSRMARSESANGVACRPRSIVAAAAAVRFASCAGGWTVTNRKTSDPMAASLAPAAEVGLERR